MSAIENLMNIGQVQMVYNWDVLVRSPFVNIDDFKFRARSAMVPDDTSEAVPIAHKFYNVWYPGRDGSSHTIDLSFWDAEDLAVWKALNAWREAIQSLALGTQAPKQAIAGIVELKLLSGLQQQTGSWLLINAWPESLQQTSLDYTTSDAVTLAVTFRFDVAEKQF